MSRCFPPNRLTRPPQGVAMFMAVVMLVVFTLLALGAFRHSVMAERTAGNTLDKQRALEVADTVLRYGEWWLNHYAKQPDADITVITTAAPSCSGSAVNGNHLAAMRVCANRLTDPAGNLAWPGAIEYVPPGMVVRPGGGLTASGDIQYSRPTMLYIAYLPQLSNGGGHAFLLHAAAYGGATGTVAVVSSTYLLKTDAPAEFGGATY